MASTTSAPIGEQRVTQPLEAKTTPPSPLDAAKTIVETLLGMDPTMQGSP